MDVENLVTQVMNLFYLAGFFQGLILIVSLLRNKTLGPLANRLLLILLISISVILFFFIAWLTKAITLPKYLNPFAMLSWFSVGPLFYLYIRALFDKTFTLGRVHILYFLFPMYHLFETIMMWGSVPFGLRILFEDLKSYSMLLSILYTIHSLVFSYLPIRFLKGRSEKNAVFMRRFFYIFGAAVIISFVDGIFYAAGISRFFLLQILVICFTGFVHYISKTSIRTSSHIKVNAESYKNVKLDKDEFDSLENKLANLMQSQKLFLNADLKLLDLANALDVNENTLSKLLNEHLNTGFYEYLKHYRLKEFENRLVQPQYRHQKIEAIAKDSGFRSRTTLYKAFKDKHGVSPSQYLKDHMARNLG